MPAEQNYADEHYGEHKNHSYGDASSYGDDGHSHGYGGHGYGSSDNHGKDYAEGKDGYDHGYDSYRKRRHIYDNDDDCPDFSSTSMEDVHKIYVATRACMKQNKYSVTLHKKGDGNSCSEDSRHPVSLNLTSSWKVSCCRIQFRWCLKPVVEEKDSDGICKDIVICSATQELQPFCTKACVTKGCDNDGSKVVDTLVLRNKSGDSGWYFPGYENMADPETRGRYLAWDALNQLRDSCSDLRVQEWDGHCWGPVRNPYNCYEEQDPYCCEPEEEKFVVPGFKPVGCVDDEPACVVDCEKPKDGYGNGGAKKMYDMARRHGYGCGPECEDGAVSWNILRSALSSGSARRAWNNSRLRDQVWLVMDEACKHFGGHARMKCPAPSEEIPVDNQDPNLGFESFQACLDTCQITPLALCVSGLEDVLCCGMGNDPKDREDASDDGCPERFRLKISSLQQIGKIVRKLPERFTVFKYQYVNQDAEQVEYIVGDAEDDSYSDLNGSVIPEYARLFFQENAACEKAQGIASITRPDGQSDWSGDVEIIPSDTANEIIVGSGYSQPTGKVTITQLEVVAYDPSVDPNLSIMGKEDCRFYPISDPSALCIDAVFKRSKDKTKYVVSQVRVNHNEDRNSPVGCMLDYNTKSFCDSIRNSSKKYVAGKCFTKKGSCKCKGYRERGDVLSCPPGDGPRWPAPSYAKK